MTQHVWKPSLQEVRPEDFDTQALLRAAREGRLFIRPAADPAPEKEEAAADGDTLCTAQRREEILAYVSRIEAHATVPHIHQLWTQVLLDAELGPLFYLNRYSRTRGQVNWYRVTAIVCLLREMGVYRRDLTATQLHCQLEGTTHRTSRYTGMSYYLPQREEIRRISSIAQPYLNEALERKPAAGSRQTPEE